MIAIAVLAVSADEIRRLVPLSHEVVEAVEEGFRRIAAGAVETPPIQRLDVPEHQGEVDVKTAYVRGWDSFAVKISSGFFGNRAQGLPTGNGLMVLFDSRTGVPKAVLLDGGHLTTLRTAAAGAVAAKHLARKDALTLGLVGAGEQALYQALALHLVRPFERVLIFSRSAEGARTCAGEITKTLGVPAAVLTDLERLVRESDILVTATPSQEPLIQAVWLHPGLHITAIGSDAPRKRELEPSVLHEADLVACDVLEQSLRLGECHHAVDAGLLAPGRIVELGTIAAGQRPGRTDPAQVTVCDLTGTGVQDTAIARLAYSLALQAGAGTQI
ncbi:MAG: cyclodeaminase [Thermaerobacter sp.]|nr:cyclodeaminase [Thermaerobacter sp.]